MKVQLDAALLTIDVLATVILIVGVAWKGGVAQKTLADLVEKVGIQNGRITKLEGAHNGLDKRLAVHEAKGD